MIADLPCGPIRGTALDGITVWKGVPYAEPPVGPLRLMPPQPVRPWTDVRDATKIGPIAPQVPSRAYVAMGAIALPQDEDCLSLVIWRPEGEGRRPVIVWLHGGGFATGTASHAWYDGAELARRADAVVVGVNYRLGALGFLYDPQADRGNLAVLDQTLALRWVQDNIAGFGGDPSRVTVMGQSGGGHNIGMMLTRPETAGLFHRAILLSPPFGVEPHAAAAAADVADVFRAALGDDDVRDAPVAKILDAQTRTAMRLGRMAEGYLSPPIMPVWDKAFPAPAQGLPVAAGICAARRGVPVLLGWTMDEARLFYWQDAALADLSMSEVETRLSTHPQGAAAIADVLRRAPALTPGKVFVAAVGDLCFRRPSLDFADAVAGAGGDCTVVEFTVTSDDPALGGAHCIDLPFVFGTWRNWGDVPLLSGIDAAEAGAITDTITTLIADFVAGRDTGLTAWQPDRRSMTAVGKTLKEVKA